MHPRTIRSHTDRSKSFRNRGRFALIYAQITEGKIKIMSWLFAK